MVIPFFQNDLYWRFLYVSCNAFMRALKIKTWHYSQENKGKYAMLSRIDGVNNYLMYSDTATQWDNPLCFRSPVFHGNYANWELRISTLDREGWLVITHVGAMRQYCLVLPCLTLMILQRKLVDSRTLAFATRRWTRRLCTQCRVFFGSIITTILPYPYRTTSTYGWWIL
jgi:hypothetical protein